MYPLHCTHVPASRTHCPIAPLHRTPAPYRFSKKNIAKKTKKHSKIFIFCYVFLLFCYVFFWKPVRCRGAVEGCNGEQRYDVGGAMMQHGAMYRMRNGTMVQVCDSVRGVTYTMQGLSWWDVLDRRNGVWLALQVLMLQGCCSLGMGKWSDGFCVGFHCLTVNVFWLYMSLAFCILICSLCSFCVDKWLLRAIALWTVFAWKSGRQQGQEAAVSWNSATIFLQALFVRKKEGNQTTHGCILAVSFILGISGLQICFFFQPNSGNCNLSVLMLFPLGPAFIIPYIWFLYRFLSSPIPYIYIYILLSQSSFSPAGRFLSLDWDFGTFLFLIAGVCKSAEDEKNPSNSCASCHSSTNMIYFFQNLSNIQNKFCIGFLDVHILGREARS